MTTKKENLTKACTKCKVEYPNTLEYFAKNRKVLNTRCKVCTRSAAKAWAKANPDKIKAKTMANSEKNKERSKAYYLANKEKISEASKAWSKENREKANARSRAWRKANPEKVWAKANPEENRKRRSDWYKANPEKAKLMARKNNLKKSGFTLELFNKMLKAQKNVCALCFTDKPGGPHDQWSSDHDHNTGKPRGLLCMSCNLALGHIENKNPEWIDKAKAYIEQGGFH